MKKPTMALPASPDLLPAAAPTPPAAPSPEGARRKPGPRAKPAATVKPPEATAAPGRAVEFASMTGDQWRVEDFTGLTMEFPGVSREDLPDWQQAMMAAPRQWGIVRKLFGIAPVILPIGADIDDYRTHTRTELATQLGITAANLKSELEAARIRWRPPHATVEEPMERVPAALAPPAAAVTDDQILVQYEFPEGLFRHGASKKAKFVSRVRDWEPLLKDKIVAIVARSALLLELRIWRVQDALAEEDPTALQEESRKRYRQYANDLAEATKDYQQLLAQIEEMAPWFNVTGQAMDFRAAVSAIVDGIREYRSTGATRLVDGIFTITEVQVLLRMAQQAPEPQYRLGWVVHVNSARSGLMDPRWAPGLSPGVLAKLDRGFKEGVKAAAATSGEPLPDLTADGPGGEYDELIPAVLPPAVEADDIPD